MNESSKPTIETHMGNIIRSYKYLWEGYKRHLFKMIQRSKLVGLDIRQGDSFIRFKLDYEFPHLFFIYESGEILPTGIWRHLISSDQSFISAPLNKLCSCIPAFSFLLDRPMTIIYWGDKIPFLSTTELRNLSLKNFVIKTNKPYEVSAANLVWLESAIPLTDKRFVEGLSSKYLFNSLTPPVFDDKDEIWSESPFVLIGDKKVSFLTLHKTLCAIDQKGIKINERFYRTKAIIIDRNFISYNKSVDIHEKYFDEFVQNKSIYEIILIKILNVRFNSIMNEQDRHIRYVLYPVQHESIKKLFGEENYGLSLTIASIVLRNFYLRSNHPFSFIVTPDDFKEYLIKIDKEFKKLTKTDGLFSNDNINQLGFKLFDNNEGLHVLASILGVYTYTIDDSKFSHLHPALFECLLSLENKIKEIDFNTLTKLYNITSKLLESEESNQEFTLQKTFLIQKLFKDESNDNITYEDAKRFARNIYKLRKYILFSKEL
jgi:hypothetical protein